MTCDVSCECAAVRGTASLFIPNKYDIKPVLSWDVLGVFYLKKSDLMCTKCLKPVLTVGEWK
jgi:hypothetical protein